LFSVVLAMFRLFWQRGGNENIMINFKIHRYNPEKDNGTHWQEFTIPTKHGMTVLEGLIYIKENIDSTLVFRTSCRMGICGSCGMLINNYPRLACQTQIEELNSSKIILKPLPNFPVIKDLVADSTTMFDKHKSIKPFIIRKDLKNVSRPTMEYRLLPAEIEYFEQFSYCIKCGICLAACPTTASDTRFLGPQALGQCYRYSADNRDNGAKERFKITDANHGAWYCHLAGACSESCPKGVDPALAIQLLKRKMALGSLGLKIKEPPAEVYTEPKERRPQIEAPPFNVEK
jgi:succinate dehydrogenase / fumarate reductase, iron-sulfur subunit